MRATINLSKLSDALKLVATVAQKSGSMPILGHALLRTAGPHAVKVGGTDLTTVVEIEVPAEVEEEGAATVPAKEAAKAIKGLLPKGKAARAAGGGTVAVAAERGAPIPGGNTSRLVHFAAGDARLTLSGLRPDEFPTMPAASDIRWQAVTGAEWVTALRRIGHAVSKDEARYNLTCVKLERLDGGGPRFIASDGHRMVVADAGGRAPLLPDCDVLVPNAALPVLERLCSAPAPVFVGLRTVRVAGTITRISLFAQADRTVVEIRLLQAAYPNYRQVVPPRNGSRAVLDRACLLATVARAEALGTRRDPSHIRLTADYPAGQLAVEAVNGELGQFRETLALGPDSHDHYGSGWRIGVKARYLREAVAALPDGPVEVHVDGELDPIRLSTVGWETPIAVVMPARL
jgi:DNA polymerase-3 subunit beta